jgi:hypothetical protein
VLLLSDALQGYVCFEYAASVPTCTADPEITIVEPACWQLLNWPIIWQGFVQFA